MTFDEVLAGLEAGRSYRIQEGDFETTLKPLGDGMVRHDGFSSRGGGSSDLTLDDLQRLRDRWPQEGWELIPTP